MPVRRYVTLELLPDQIRWLQKQNAALTFGLVSTIVAGCLAGWPRIAALAVAGVFALVAMWAAGKEHSLLVLHDRLTREGQTRSDQVRHILR